MWFDKINLKELHVKSHTKAYVIYIQDIMNKFVLYVKQMQNILKHLHLYKHNPNYFHKS